jgi:DNA repair exonuclease SbcCD ATPase subunit
VIEVLKDRITYLEKRGEEEREQAAKRFNENVNLLMTNLDFQEFRTVRLTGSPNYRIYVERYDPKKKDYKSQEVGTLSTSEKMAISIILQIALKETYLRSLPFLILDDVLEDFDSKRRDRVIDYLKEKVEKEGWFIIATRLVKEIGPPRIEYI